MIADDGIHVWVDGVILIDKWSRETTSPLTAKETLGAGLHTARVEYVEKTGSAHVSLTWTKG